MSVNEMPQQSRWAVMDGTLTEAQAAERDAQITPATPTAQEVANMRGVALLPNLLDRAIANAATIAALTPAPEAAPEAAPAPGIAEAAAVLLTDLNAIDTLVKFQLRHTVGVSDKTRSMRYKQVVAALRALKGWDV